VGVEPVAGAAEGAEVADPALAGRLGAADVDRVDVALRVEVRLTDRAAVRRADQALFVFG
jgi:hypothetical protein